MSIFVLQRNATYTSEWSTKFLLNEANYTVSTLLQITSDLVQKAICRSVDGALKFQLYIVQSIFHSFAKMINNGTANHISFATDC